MCVEAGGALGGKGEKAGEDVSGMILSFTLVVFTFSLFTFSCSVALVLGFFPFVFSLESAHVSLVVVFIWKRGDNAL